MSGIAWIYGAQQWINHDLFIIQAYAPLNRLKKVAEQKKLISSWTNEETVNEFTEQTLMPYFHHMFHMAFHYLGFVTSCVCACVGVVFCNDFFREPTGESHISLMTVAGEDVRECANIGCQEGRCKWLLKMCFDLQKGISFSISYWSQWVLLRKSCIHLWISVSASLHVCI